MRFSRKRRQIKNKEEGHIWMLTVNATAKLIGECGAPGYCQGKISESFWKPNRSKDAAFPDHEYIELVRVHVHFARQVGSQYHVTSYNAGNFFVFQKQLNKRTYLHSSSLTGFCLITYSDLMMFVNSEQKLNKSALDMNIHYLELKGFEEELTQDPQQTDYPQLWSLSLWTNFK